METTTIMTDVLQRVRFSSHFCVQMARQTQLACHAYPTASIVRGTLVIAKCVTQAISITLRLEWLFATWIVLPLRTV